MDVGDRFGWRTYDEILQDLCRGNEANAESMKDHAMSMGRMSRPPGDNCGSTNASQTALT